VGACGGEGAPSGATVTDSADVEVISLPGVDDPLPWSAEKVLEIPPVEEGEKGFFDVAGVTVLTNGRIAVLDRLGKKVVRFSREGEFLDQYGREGSGPGEFQYPIQLSATPHGGILVFDLMNRRLERFDSTLTPLAPTALQIPYFGGQIAYSDEFLVLPTTDPEVVDGTVQLLTAMGAGDTLEVVRYSRETSGPIQLESCGMGLSGIPPLFSPSTLWAPGPEGRLVVVGTNRYEVDVYRAPTFDLERRIRRNVPVLEASRKLAEGEVGDAMRVMTPSGERRCEAAEVAEKRGWAPEIPPISRVAVSPAGDVFLERWAPRGEDSAIDVLAPDGSYRGTLAPGFPFPTAFLDETHLVTTEDNELDLTSVVVYRIGR